MQNLGWLINFDVLTTIKFDDLYNNFSNCQFLSLVLHCSIPFLFQCGWSLTSAYHSQAASDVEQVL